VYALDAQVHLSLLQGYAGWLTSWTHIISIQTGFPSSSLLF